jgi:hypothetical protein
MTEPLRAAPELHVLTPFLRACGGVDGAATVLLLGACIALAPLLIAPVPDAGTRGALIGTSLCVGLIEKYFALRVRFDLQLFERIAEGRLDLDALDRGFGRLFGSAAPVAGRDWESRARGTITLARRQLAFFSAQGLLLGLAALSFVFG